MFLRFDPLCGDPNPNDPFCGCPPSIQQFNDSLPVVAGDFWQLPELDPSSSWDLVDACGNFVADLKTTRALTPSSFVFQITNITSDSGFRIVQTCGCAEPTISTLVKRSDYLTDDAYLIAINTMASAFLGVTGAYANNVFTFSWTTDPSCLCSATWNTVGSFTVAEGDCGKPFLESPLPYLTPTVISQPNVCYPVTRCLDQIQFQTAGLCLEITQRNVCIDQTPPLQLLFPRNLLPGCYYIVSAQYGCSQPIIVASACDTAYCEFRNLDEQSTFIRLKLSFSNPLWKKDQEVSRSSQGQIRKLYSQITESWDMETDYYRANLHRDLLICLEKDFVQITAQYPDSTTVKQFVTEEAYNPEWLSDQPRIPIAKGRVRLTLSNYLIVNSFC